MVRLTTHKATSELMPMTRRTVSATMLAVTPTAWRQPSATRSPSVYLGIVTVLWTIVIRASSKQDSRRAYHVLWQGSGDDGRRVSRASRPLTSDQRSVRLLAADARAPGANI